MVEKEPFVDKTIIAYLKEVYTTRELLSLTKDMSPALSIGYMQGVQEIINRLEAIATREEY